MPAITAIQDIPYMLGTDALGQVDLRIKALADYFESTMSARAKAYRSVNQAGIVTATLTAVLWDAEEHDQGGLHSLVSNTDRFTAVVAGRYDVNAQVAFAAHATGYRTVSIFKNGLAGTLIGHTRVAAVSGIATVVPCFGEVSLAAGDYVVIGATHTAGVNIDLSGGNGNTNVSIRKTGEV